MNDFRPGDLIRFINSRVCREEPKAFVACSRNFMLDSVGIIVSIVDVQPDYINITQQYMYVVASDGTVGWVRSDNSAEIYGSMGSVVRVA